MIEINNLTTNAIDKELLKMVCEKVLQGEKTKEKNLSIALVGQGRMREINKKYRKKNRATDVLSFPDNGLGEIIICLREIKKNAKKDGFSFEKELTQVLIHGILHLLGYDHEKSEKQAKKMEEKQNYYLKLCQESIQ
ncbi:rRNA maturation RNase YbeY [Candidatus Parcubacteria bacterium]|nr:rRNA maturation RNase YbeY [Candidatus Parcubacteria bacterium]